MLSSPCPQVCEVKRDMVAIRSELDTVQQVKEEIEELREYVDRLEEHTHRRKLRLLEQVLRCGGPEQPGAARSSPACHAICFPCVFRY